MGRLLASLKVLLLLGAESALANDVAASTVPRGAESPQGSRVAQVQVAATPPLLDGRLDEPLWATVPVLADFVQLQPVEGAPARHPTEVRVARDGTHLYVGARLRDSEPERIQRHLTRRDMESQADWFEVAVDGNHDRRTAQAFRVNAAGVQRDVLYYDDVAQDARWDAVWRSAVQVDGEGWTVELAIPLSQLRFDGSAERWGLQLTRFVFRERETSAWQRIPVNQGVHVSRFGELVLGERLQPPAHLEVRPYVASGATLAQPSSSLLAPSAPLRLHAGADVKWQVSPGLQLTATALPDFGQVEADPAQVNLTDQQLFFPEQRPFFLEGLDLFGGQGTDSGLGYGVSAPALFYTRRIGAPPTAEPERPAGAEAVDRPDETPIYGALKLSGRTAQGTSFGLLDALTGAVDERYADAGGRLLTERRTVQPLTHLLVARAQQELAGGSTKLGLTGTTVNRRLEGPLQGLLGRNAFAGGADWSVRFLDDAYHVSGQLLASHVEGSRESITTLQENFTRYAQRPDARHLGVDMDAMHLDGAAGELRVGRSGDRFFNWEARGSFVSPGFEVNDLGFQNRADEATLGTRLQWQDQTPGPLLRNWTLTTHLTARTNFGGELLAPDFNADFSALTHGFLPVGVVFMAYLPGKDDRLLRGGPLASGPLDVGLNLIAGTDVRERLRANVTAAVGGSTAGGEDWLLNASVEGEPLPFLSFRLKPFVYLAERDAQYVDAWDDAAAADTFGRRYLFSRISSVTSALEARLEWTFSPTLSLQTYARASVVSGRYTGYKLFTRPGEREFDRSATVLPDASGVTVQAPGSAVAHHVDTPDFLFRSLQGNAVLRWEYLPGSTLSVVYQLGCSEEATTDGRFRPGAYLKPCGDAAPEHSGMLKLTYWWSA